MTRQKPLAFDGPTHVIWRGRRLVYFAGCDYLRLSGHPQLREATLRAMERSPWGTGASRVTTGEQEAYADAERAIAKFMQQPAAILTAAGYLAPIAAMQALGTMATHVIVDEAAHACVSDGALLSGLPMVKFAHGDVAALRSAIRDLPRGARPVIACDGLMGSRGVVSPLASYLAELPERGWLLVDDAHGLGTMGPRGKGSVRYKGLNDSRIVQTVSLSKALAMQGGAVVGPRRVVEAVYAHAPAFVGNTAPLVPVVAGVRAAVRLVANDVHRVNRLQMNAALLHDLVRENRRIGNDPESPVMAVFPPNMSAAKRLRDRLLVAGIYPPWIRYLGGPKHGFFRCALSSEHAVEQVRALGHVLAED